MDNPARERRDVEADDWQALLDEPDEMADLTAFETEHRRILAMQSLYYRRRRSGESA